MTGKRRAITTTDQRRTLQLAAQGETIERIAAAIGRHPGTVAKMVARYRHDGMLDPVQVVAAAGKTPGKAVLNAASRVLTVDGNAVQLGHTAARIIEALASHAPGYVQAVRLYNLAWDNGHASDPSKIMMVTIHHLRAKLADANIPNIITALRGAGYALTVPVEVIGSRRFYAVPMAIAREARRALQDSPRTAHLAAWFDDARAS